jgi:phage host-nuclease inhibitor protein Gam
MNQKELNELGDLINERRDLEVKFKVDVAKLDERIAAKVGKLQPEPVKPETVTTYHRKERSDKGQARKGSAPEPASQPGPSGGDPVTIDPAYMQPEPTG